MRKTAAPLTLIFVLLAATFPFTIFPAKAEPRTITVPDDYPTIQAAIGNATAGDTVFVKKGTYYSNYKIIIDKPIFLLGEDSQNTILRYKDYYRYVWEAIIEVAANNITVSGFTIDGAVYNVTFPGAPPIVPDDFYPSINDVGVGILSDQTNGKNVSGINVFGNNIIHMDFTGVSIYGEMNLIHQNNITGNYGGIYISGKNNSVYQNNITGNEGYGIIFSSSDTTISNNTIVGNRIGISVYSAQNMTIHENSIQGNGVEATAVEKHERGGLSISYGAQNIYVYENNITDNYSYGVEFDGSCNNSEIFRNNILRNNVGVNLRNFVLTSYDSVGSGNKIYRNNIIDNAQNAFVERVYPYSFGAITGQTGNGTDIVSWDNGKLGNHWSDYQSKYPNATEIDASGVGNLPYFIDENNTDRFPLLQLVDIYAEAPNIARNQEPFPVLLVAAAVAVIIATAVGLLLYNRKKR